MTNSPSTGEIITNHEYHHGDGWRALISSTRFKSFIRSPAEFHWPLPALESAALDGGTATHTVILDPERLDDLVVLPDIPFRSGADKDTWRTWLADFGASDADVLASTTKDGIINTARKTAAQKGKTIATQEQRAAATAMALSVQENPLAAITLEDAHTEMSYRAFGRKARFDAMKGTLLSDVKTCAQIDRFQWQLRDLSYDISLAWYEQVLAACGVPVSDWAWIVVESKPFRMASDGLPRHRTNVYTASEELRMAALECVSHALQDYRACNESGHWPDTPMQPQELLPFRT